jgi:hypothetical protein
MDLVTFVHLRQTDFLTWSQAQAKDTVYKKYSAHEAGGGSGEGSESDEDFAAFCKGVGESGSAHLYYLPPNGGGLGFHKFLSAVCDGDEHPATTRIYINCTSTTAAKRILLVLAIYARDVASGMIEFKCVPPSGMFQRTDRIVAYFHGQAEQKKAFLSRALGELAKLRVEHSWCFGEGLPHMVKPAKDGEKNAMPGIGWADEPPLGGLVEGEKDSTKQSFGTFHAGLLIQALYKAKADLKAERLLTTGEIQQALEHILADRQPPIDPDRPYKIYPRPAKTEELEPQPKKAYITNRSATRRKAYITTRNLGDEK